jgi:hypothetical protein
LFAKEKLNSSMVKYLAILLVLLNYVQCQSQLQKVSIQPNSLNFLNNAYKLHITNQQSHLLNENIIDKRALILNSRSLDSPYNHYLKNYYYHNPLIFDWMEIRYKDYRYKYDKIDEYGYNPLIRFVP